MSLKGLGVVDNFRADPGAVDNFWQATNSWSPCRSCHGGNGVAGRVEPGTLLPAGLDELSHGSSMKSPSGFVKKCAKTRW